MSTLHSILISAALSAPAGLAAQAAPQEPAEGPRVQILEGVQLIVNDECITSSDLLRMAATRGDVSGAEQDLGKLLQQSANDLTRSMLMQQAGRDLGYDDKLVGAMVRDEMSARRENFGSVTALAEVFDEARIDSATFKDDTEKRIYGILWRRATNGEYIGAGGRAFVDRYVRPGQLKLAFRRLGSSLDLPAKVRLQEIIIASDVGESLQGARQRALLVRSRARRGEDFAALNVEFGVPTRRVDGELQYDIELDPIEEAQLSARPTVLEFVRSAQPGDVSEPIPASNAAGVVSGYLLLRFVERIEGAAKSFQDREFQSELRRTQVERRDEFVVEGALARLMAAAYIWPPLAAKRPAPGVDSGADESGAAPGAGQQEPGEAVEPPAGPEAAPADPPVDPAPSPGGR